MVMNSFQKLNSSGIIVAVNNSFVTCFGYSANNLKDIRGPYYLPGKISKTGYLKKN